MHNVIVGVGSHPLLGVVVVLVAGVALVLYEYLHLKGVSTRSGYMPVLLGVAMGTTAICLVLMAFRFITVAGL